MKKNSIILILILSLGIVFSAHNGLFLFNAKAQSINNFQSSQPPIIVTSKTTLPPISSSPNSFNLPNINNPNNSPNPNPNVQTSPRQGLVTNALVPTRISPSLNPNPNQVQRPQGRIAPIPNAGIGQTVYDGATFKLDGTKSYDPNPGGSIVNYRWVQTSGAPSMLIGSSNSPNPTFIAPRLSTTAAPTVLTFSLIITDNFGLTSTVPSTTSVIVTHNSQYHSTGPNSTPIIQAPATTQNTIQQLQHQQRLQSAPSAQATPANSAAIQPNNSNSTGLATPKSRAAVTSPQSNSTSISPNLSTTPKARLSQSAPIAAAQTSCPPSGQLPSGQLDGTICISYNEEDMQCISTTPCTPPVVGDIHDSFSGGLKWGFRPADPNHDFVPDAATQFLSGDTNRILALHPMGDWSVSCDEATTDNILSLNTYLSAGVPATFEFQGTVQGQNSLLPRDTSIAQTGVYGEVRVEGPPNPTLSDLTIESGVNGLAGPITFLDPSVSSQLTGGPYECHGFPPGGGSLSGAAGDVFPLLNGPLLKGPGFIPFTTDSNGNWISSPNALQQSYDSGTQCITLTETDENGNPLYDCSQLVDSEQVSFVIHPFGTNNPPTPRVTVTPSSTVDANTQITMDASASSDPDQGDSIASYQWSENPSSPPVTLSSTTSSVVQFTAPKLDKDTVLTFTLTVADNHGLTASTQVPVTVNHVNHPPVAVANINIDTPYVKDQIVHAVENTIVTLDGRESKDPDPGDTLTYKWTQNTVLGSDVPVTIEQQPDSPTATIVTPDHVPAKYAGSDSSLPILLPLAFDLTVTDNHGLESVIPATVQVPISCSAEEEGTCDTVNNRVSEIIANEENLHLKEAPIRMQHWLAGSGTEMPIDVNWLRSASTIQNAEKVNELRFETNPNNEGSGNSITNTIQNIIPPGGPPGKTGPVQIGFSDAWQKVITVTQEDISGDIDLGAAVGTTQLNSAGNFKITKEGPIYTITGDVTNSLNDANGNPDRFDFNPGQTFLVPTIPITIKADDLNLLEKCRGAKSFLQPVSYIMELNAKGTLQELIHTATLPAPNNPVWKWSGPFPNIGPQTQVQQQQSHHLIAPNNSTISPPPPLLPNSAPSSTNRTASHM